MKTKLSDYIANRLVGNRINRVFMVTGGGAMHLNNSLGSHPGLKVIFNHHEQACAMGAEGYARASGMPALVSVTSGPGGTNAITGVLGAWLDSIPMLIISGQVRFDTTVRSTGLHLRQIGDQEYDIIRMVSHITKYAVMVTKPDEIRYHLDKAIFLMMNGRRGPCWLDIPLNVQAAMIDTEKLAKYDDAADAKEIPPSVTSETAEAVISKIKAAKRPVLMAGTAVCITGTREGFVNLAERLNIPVVTAFNAHDVIQSDHPLYAGRPGTVGDRAGNFAVQNSDLLLVLGCRLNIRQISYNWQGFAREAFKIMVDIDPVEFLKPTLKIDMPIRADVGDFMSALINGLEEKETTAHKDWVDWCRARKKRYPVILKEYWDRTELVNPYCFVEALGRHLPEGQVIVTGNGAACVCTFQALQIKKGQVLFSNSGCASMGYDLPAAIGACLGAGGRSVVCLAGDGSLQMNLQELQTVAHNKLSVKMFVFNNNGYHSIRQTQQNFFNSNFVGCDPASGVSFPDLEKIAGAYQIPFSRCATHVELDTTISRAMNDEGPHICEIMLTTEQPFSPKVSSFRKEDGKIVSRPLEDLAPFLDRAEFLENMIIKPLPE